MQFQNQLLIEQRNKYRSTGSWKYKHVLEIYDVSFLITRRSSALSMVESVSADRHVKEMIEATWDHPCRTATTQIQQHLKTMSFETVS